jgi:hypothetical protein
MKTAAMLLLLTTAALAEEDKVRCIQIEGVTGQQFFECPQPEDIEKIKNLKSVPKPITEEEIAKLQPSEENKKWFLERGYKLNNNSMVRWGSIDLSSESPEVKSVKTVPVMPVAEWTEKNMLDRAADRKTETNVCTIHHMRKVTTADGLSWHCRK